MTDYPEDILRAAEEAAMLVIRNSEVKAGTKAIAAALAAERERCAKIAEEIAYIEGTDFGSVNAIRFGWPEIDTCQHGEMSSMKCDQCPPEARQKWWEAAAIRGEKP